MPEVLVNGQPVHAEPGQTVMQAALEAGRPCRVLAELGHARCHPVPLAFPEGEYLKGLLLAAG